MNKHLKLLKQALKSLKEETITLLFSDFRLKCQVIGILLGNLDIKIKNKKTRITYKRKLTEYNYFDSVTVLLEGLIKKGSFEISRNTYCKILLEEHPIYESLKKEFYNEKGKKIIPETIDNYMSEDFLAMLYLEIGYLEERFKKNQYAFDVSNFDINSIERLQDSMFRILGLNFIIKQKKSKVSLVMINTEKLKEFNELLNSCLFPFFVPLMNYKIERKILLDIKNEKEGLLKLKVLGIAFPYEPSIPLLAQQLSKNKKDDK